MAAAVLQMTQQYKKMNALILQLKQKNSQRIESVAKAKGLSKFIRINPSKFKGGYDPDGGDF